MIKIFRTKKYYRKKIKDFLNNLERPVFEKKYLEYHKHKIDALKWLLAFYEERATTTPKDLLESYLTRVKANDELRPNLEWIKILYYWINYKKIEGF